MDWNFGMKEIGKVRGWVRATGESPEKEGGGAGPVYEHHTGTGLVGLRFPGARRGHPTALLGNWPCLETDAMHAGMGEVGELAARVRGRS